MSRVIGANFDDRTAAELDALAEQRGDTVSAALREVVNAGLRALGAGGRSQREIVRAEIVAKERARLLQALSRAINDAWGASETSAGHDLSGAPRRGPGRPRVR